MSPFEPELLPAAIQWEPLIPYLGPANRALASFDGILYGVPNPEILLSPLTTREAVLSSKIEGTRATLGEVLKFEAGEPPQQESRQIDIQEILNYRTALRRAEEELRSRPFNLNLLLDLHSILLDSVRGRNKARGFFRTVQNWIGKPGCSIDEADFVPPQPGRVPELMGNWEKYYHCERPDPIVQLAILHAQFEIIHPFLDGNGRLGRILVPLFLYERRLLSRPVFYLSSYLEDHRDEYVSRLRTISSDADGWQRWIEFFLAAVGRQAEANLSAARAIIDLYERLKNQIIDLTHSQFAIPLLDALFERPIFATSELEGRAGLPSKQMIMALLAKLKQSGILLTLREASGRRSQILVFAELLSLCEGREIAHVDPRGRIVFSIT